MNSGTTGLINLPPPGCASACEGALADEPACCAVGAAAEEEGEFAVAAETGEGITGLCRSQLYIRIYGW